MLYGSVVVWLRSAAKVGHCGRRLCGCWQTLCSGGQKLCPAFGWGVVVWSEVVLLVSSDVAVVTRCGQQVYGYGQKLCGCGLLQWQVDTVADGR